MCEENAHEAQDYQHRLSIKQSSYEQLSAFYGRIVSIRFFMIGAYITVIVALIPILLVPPALEKSSGTVESTVNGQQSQASAGSAPGDTVPGSGEKKANVDASGGSDKEESETGDTDPTRPLIIWWMIFVANCALRLFDARNTRVLYQLASAGRKVELDAEVSASTGFFGSHYFGDSKSESKSKSNTTHPWVLSPRRAFMDSFFPFYRILTAFICSKKKSRADVKDGEGKFKQRLACASLVWNRITRSVVSHSFTMTAIIGVVNVVLIKQLFFVEAKFSCVIIVAVALSLLITGVFKACLWKKDLREQFGTEECCSDKKAYIKKWSEIEPDISSQKITQRLCIGGYVQLARIEMNRDALIKRQSHDSELMVCVEVGRVRFMIQNPGSADYDLRQIVTGEDVVYIPPNVKYRAIALEKAVLLIVISPPDR